MGRWGSFTDLHATNESSLYEIVMVQSPLQSLQVRFVSLGTGGKNYTCI